MGLNVEAYIDLSSDLFDPACVGVNKLKFMNGNRHIQEDFRIWTDVPHIHLF